MSEMQAQVQTTPNGFQGLMWGRHRILLVVVIVLVLGGAALIFWGMLTSVGLYSDGTVFSQEQWRRLEAVRARLAEAGVSPEALEALDGALIEPRPGDDAETAAYLKLALHALEDDVPTNPDAAWAARELRVILSQAALTSDYPTSTPWITISSPVDEPTPTWAVPTFEWTLAAP